MSKRKEFYVGDIVSNTVLDKIGIIETKVLDPRNREFVYSIKSGLITLYNVSSHEIIKGDSNV